LSNQSHLLALVASAPNEFIIGGMNANFMDTFGKRVRLLRRDRKWTQGKLRDEIEKCGAVVQRSYISKMESSEQIPSGEVVRAIALALDTTTDFLLMLTDDHRARTEDAELDALDAWSEEAEEVAQLVDAMKPDRRRDAVAVIHALYQADSTQSAILRRYDIIMNRIRDRRGDAGAASAEDELLRLIDSWSASALGAA
jgi:transcriptional regulator with XRE-family HTH domain